MTVLSTTFHSLLAVALLFASVFSSASTVQIDPIDQLRKLGVDVENTSFRSIIYDRQRSDDERYLAAKALGQSKHENAQEILLALLNESDEESRFLALHGLTYLSSAATLPMIKLAVDYDESLNVREAALYALWRVGGAGVFVELNQIALSDTQQPELRRLAVSMLSDLKSESPNLQLTSIFDSTHGELKAETALYLSYYCEKEMMPHLLSSVLSNDLPIGYWVSVTRRLEKITGEDFSLAPSKELAESPKARQEATTRILAWASKQEF